MSQELFGRAQNVETGNKKKKKIEQEKLEGKSLMISSAPFIYSLSNGDKHYKYMFVWSWISKLNSVADTSNVCTVEIGKDVPYKLGYKVCSMAKLQGCWNKFFFLIEIWLKDVRTRRKWRTRNMEKSKYLHLISYNYLKNIVKKKLNLKIKM